MNNFLKCIGYYVAQKVITSLTPVELLWFISAEVWPEYWMCNIFRQITLKTLHLNLHVSFSIWCLIDGGVKDNLCSSSPIPSYHHHSFHTCLRIHQAMRKRKGKGKGKRKRKGKEKKIHSTRRKKNLINKINLCLQEFYISVQIHIQLCDGLITFLSLGFFLCNLRNDTILFNLDVVNLKS